MFSKKSKQPEKAEDTKPLINNDAAERKPTESKEKSRAHSKKEEKHKAEEVCLWFIKVFVLD